MIVSEITDPGTLPPKELEAVYAIARAVGQSMNIDMALDEISLLTRPVFIFDSIILYLPTNGNGLEAAYARLIGRGQSAEGDQAWGESISNETFQTGQVIMRSEKLDGWETDRLRTRYYLGLPLRIREELMGTLVFCRFGGPPYTPEQIHLAEFIAAHVAQILGHKQLIERVGNLEAEKRLDQLQKDFIATISHELNTPLGFIKGYATTLLRTDINWDETTRREFLTIIDEEADRLRELIDNLLDSSRLQSGTLPMQFQLVRMDSFLRDITVRASSRYKNLPIQLDIKKTDVRCQADPTRLAQVLENLLSNAVKYAPDANVTLSLDTSPGKVHIAVQDNGPGIAPEHQSHLFGRFFRAPEDASKVRGTGLGLFICRQIINAHGGEITVESTVGVGTTFHIYLPMDEKCENKGIPKEEEPK